MGMPAQETYWTPWQPMEPVEPLTIDLVRYFADVWR
jgi:hypothetical protein